MVRMSRTSHFLVPALLCALGVVSLVLSGCRKEQEGSAEPPAYSPAVYMKDPVFRKQLTDKRKELQSIVAERAPLVKRMEELVRSNRADLAALQQNAEWTNLYTRVVSLNKKYEETRQRQLKIVRERITPQDKDKISK